MADPSGTRESVLRDYLYEHPELLFDAPIVSRAKEVCVEGKFIDLLFEVEGIHHIVELKRDSITREAVGQVMEYYGRLRHSNPTRKYRMVLAAPNIPKYRSIPLEEFGIRCVEISFPQYPATPVIEQREHEAAESVRTVLRRNLTPDEIDIDRPEFVTFAELLPPANANAVRLANKLLLDAIPAVQQRFSEFEIKPIKMNRPNAPDVLCLPSSSQTSALNFVKGGAWWAFAFGESEQLPKNDTPNISVNALPWGLDFAINAELRTSQAVMLNRIERQPQRFDELVKGHGQLALQMWLKLEHQPRFYYWVPVGLHPIGAWNGQSLLEEYADRKATYSELKIEWLERIMQSHSALSESQKAHLHRRNGDLNLAIRVVKTIEGTNSIWAKPYAELTASFTSEYLALKPLIQFFN